MSENASKRPKWIWLYAATLIGLLLYGFLIPRILPLAVSNIPTDDLFAYETFSHGWTETPAVRAVLEPWLRWDTEWFLEIATDGYQPGNVEVAYPLVYPMLIRFAGWLLGGQYLLAALLISWGSLLGVCFLLEEWGKDHAQSLAPATAIRNLLFFPTAIFLFAGYAESLFLLLILLAWHYADRGKWLLVGLLGAIAVLTKFVGIFLVLPFAYLWWKKDFPQKKFGGLVALGLIPLAYYAWVGYAKVVYGITPSDALNLGWALHFDWPFIGIIGSIQRAISNPLSETLFIFVDLVAVGIVLISLVWWAKRKRGAEVLFMGALLLVSLMKITDTGILGSTSRYMLPLFPMYYTHIPSLEKKPANLLVFAVTMILWLLCATMFFTWNWLA